MKSPPWITAEGEPARKCEPVSDTARLKVAAAARTEVFDDAMEGAPFQMQFLLAPFVPFFAGAQAPEVLRRHRDLVAKQLKDHAPNRLTTDLNVQENARIGHAEDHGGLRPVYRRGGLLFGCGIRRRDRTIERVSVQAMPIQKCESTYVQLPFTCT